MAQVIGIPTSHTSANRGHRQRLADIRQDERFAEYSTDRSNPGRNRRPIAAPLGSLMGVIAKSGVLAPESSGDQIDLCYLNTVFELYSGYHLGQVIEAA